jgi:hypothetical protein
MGDLPRHSTQDIQQGRPIPRDFEIPEADMDQGLLRIFVGKEELLSYVDAWIA